MLIEFDKEFYIARDEDGGLFAYEQEPMKAEYEWTNRVTESDYEALNPELFPEIAWDDEKPVKVKFIKV